LVRLTAIWNILWTFGIFCGNLIHFSVLVCCAKKNLATLIQKYISEKKILREAVKEVVTVQND
jgi:hypothetical protein